jgi:hypothetical protein
MVITKVMHNYRRITHSMTGSSHVAYLHKMSCVAFLHPHDEAAGPLIALVHPRWVVYCEHLFPGYVLPLNQMKVNNILNQYETYV